MKRTPIKLKLRQSEIETLLQQHLKEKPNKEKKTIWQLYKESDAKKRS